jgi:hypothetical protein
MSKLFGSPVRLRHGKTSATLSYAQALERMREGSKLMHMHTNSNTGHQYSVVPGGQVSDQVAEQLKAHKSVIAEHDGLFPGHSQLWHMKSFSVTTEGSS